MILIFIHKKRQITLIFVNRRLFNTEARVVHAGSPFDVFNEDGQEPVSELALPWRRVRCILIFIIRILEYLIYKPGACGLSHRNKTAKTKLHAKIRINLRMRAVLSGPNLFVHSLFSGEDLEEVRRDHSNPISLKISCESWYKLVIFIYSKYSHPLHFTLYFSSTIPFSYL